MQLSQLKECKDCSTLEKLYDDIGCSIFQMMKNKWNGVAYGTDSFFSQSDFIVLLRLKRLIEKRLYNKSYPDSKYSNQDLISLGIKYLYKQDSCPDCPCQDFTDFITPCYCYTVSNNLGELGPVITTTYKDCDGNEVKVKFLPSQTRNLCAPKGTEFHPKLQVVTNGDCTTNCTSTTTSTTIAP